VDVKVNDQVGKNFQTKKVLDKVTHYLLSYLI
jgi:hypothetical protein